MAIKHCIIIILTMAYKLQVYSYIFEPNKNDLNNFFFVMSCVQYSNTCKTY